MAVVNRMFLAPFGVAFAGLTIGYKLKDGSGNVISTGTMSEDTGTGLYRAVIPVDNSAPSYAVSDSPTGIDPYYREFDQA